MKKDENPLNKTHASIRLDNEDIRILDELASMMGATRSAAMRMCIRYTARDMEEIRRKTGKSFY